jgi:hypothetical protein
MFRLKQVNFLFANTYFGFNFLKGLPEELSATPEMLSDAGE